MGDKLNMASLNETIYYNMEQGRPLESKIGWSEKGRNPWELPSFPLR